MPNALTQVRGKARAMDLRTRPERVKPKADEELGEPLSPSAAEVPELRQAVRVPNQTRIADALNASGGSRGGRFGTGQTKGSPGAMGPIFALNERLMGARCALTRARGQARAKDRRAPNGRNPAVSWARKGRWPRTRRR